MAAQFDVSAETKELFKCVLFRFVSTPKLTSLFT